MEKKSNPVKSTQLFQGMKKVIWKQQSLFRTDKSEKPPNFSNLKLQKYLFQGEHGDLLYAGDVTTGTVLRHYLTPRKR